MGFPVVGIGASAGGVEACIEFFKATPPDSGMAFVIVMHLSPDKESHIAEILARHTEMPVIEVTDGLPIERDRVYVIAPARTMVLREGRLRLTEPLEARGHRHPVDDFFRSLAEEQRERAVCVVLSGMGSNGTAGAQFVKYVGGVCVAQSPETAKFPSMPRSLIDAELADFIMRPDQMAEALVRYARHPYAAVGRRATDVAALDRRAFDEILSVLRTRSRRDFSGYKQATVLRRIQRRMSLHHVESLAEYAMVLRGNAAEATGLSDDLVIHVTNFFRDPPAWEALAERVIAPLVADRDSGSSVRCWVTACSSGEEAYSLAMLLSEAMEKAEKSLEIKIFATDLADRALAHARAGSYPHAIENEVSPERLAAFFEKGSTHYQVRKELREMVLFAPQDVLQDPPFSRIDICTCRNLLIYLAPAMQRRVQDLMYFSLRDGGTLFLGNSETISGEEGRFTPIVPRWRIFRKTGGARRPDIDFPVPEEVHAAVRSSPARVAGRPNMGHAVHRTLLDRFAPVAVVVDRQHRVVFFHGETKAYLSQPSGEPTRDLVAMSREGVRGAVRLALGDAIARNAEVTVTDGVIESDEGRQRISVVVAPLETTDASEYFLVCFVQTPEPELLGVEGGGENDPALVAELHRVRAQLQRTVDELQTSNEELKASNEEATSVNEEFQSTNEELETSKEELQSLNEELVTVNAQLRDKMVELENTTNDLESLLSSTDIAVIFLDSDFRIRRFTPAARALIDLIPTDIGRPLHDLAPKFTDPDLADDARSVLDRLVPIEREVGTRDGRWFMRRVLPYRTVNNRIEGVVVTFVDITRRRAAETAKRHGEVAYHQTIQSIRDHGIIMLDTRGDIIGWNTGAVAILGFTPEEMIGRNIREIFVEEDRQSGESDREIEVAAAEGTALDERWHRRKGGTRFWASGTLNALRDETGELTGFVKILRDQTVQKELTESLDRARASAELANRSKDHFIAMISHELRTPLSIILMWSKMLRQDGLEGEDLDEAIDAIGRSAESQSRLIEDLLDSSRIAAGKLSLDLGPADFGQIVTRVVDLFWPAIESKKIECVVEIDGRAGVVECDADRIQQVVRNLLANALKFTPEGGRIGVSVRREDESVELSVTDSGVGIDPAFLPRIFERFTQGDSTRDRPHGGLGLGLSIVQSIVEMHGGSVTPFSDGEGKGARFVVHLPLHPTATGAPDGAAIGAAGTGGAGGAGESSGRLQGKRVLLIEDQPDAAAVIGTSLRRAGAEVSIAGDGLGGLGLFEANPFDLVISDIGLPDIDGFEFIKRARQNEKSLGRSPVPAVALTAYGGSENQKHALQVGFNAFMVKPSDPETLISELGRLIPTVSADKPA